MTKHLKAAVAALALPVAALSAAPAAAQSNSVAVVDIEQAVQRSNAWTTAVQQMQTTYAQQIAAVTARRNAIQAELQPLVQQFQTAQQQPNANQDQLRTQLQAIQGREQTAQRELQTLNQPVALAQAYAQEQIVGRLDAAVRAAMTAKRVTLVVQPGAVVLSEPAADITQDVVGELNRTVPNVQIVPPAGWQPGQQGQAQPGQPAPAQPAAPQPQGR